MTALLEIQNLTLEGRAAGLARKFVDGLSISISEGETLALVGESGSGKSVTALAILGLLPEREVEVTDGRIKFMGSDLLAMPARERRKVAGSGIAMIFQEPMASLNPVMRVGDQIVEMIRAHERVSRAAAMSRAAELLGAVRMPEPVLRLHAYPHQLSGGQRQRVMTAMALACRPKLLIADEPTTALDVTVQAHILELLRDLQLDLDMAMLFITHDLGVVANIAENVAILYCGRLVETAPVAEIFSRPSHPYTRGLLACIPTNQDREGELEAIPGQMPAPSESVDPCPYAPRCELSDSRCRTIVPPVISPSVLHRVHCHHAYAGAAA